MFYLFINLTSAFFWAFMVKSSVVTYRTSSIMGEFYFANISIDFEYVISFVGRKERKKEESNGVVEI